MLSMHYLIKSSKQIYEVGTIILFKDKETEAYKLACQDLIPGCLTPKTIPLNIQQSILLIRATEVLRWQISVCWRRPSWKKDPRECVWFMGKRGRGWQHTQVEKWKCARHVGVPRINLLPAADILCTDTSGWKMVVQWEKQIEARLWKDLLE